MSRSNSKSILSLASANAFAQVMQFAIFLFVARQLGPFEFGSYLMAILVAGFVISLFDFGRGTFFTRELAFGRLSHSDYWSQASRNITFLAAVCLPVLISLFYMGQYLAVATCIIVWTQFSFQLIQALSKSEIQTLKLSIAVIADKVGFFLIVYLFHSLSLLSASTTLIGASFGQLIGMAVLLARAKAHVSKWRFADILKFLDFRPSFHLGIFSITNSLTTLDQVILGITTGQIQTGYYGAVSKWFAPLGILSGSVSVVVANDAAKRHQSAFGAVASDRLTWLSLGLVGLLTGLAGLFGSEIVPLILGSSYANSQELFLFLALSAALALVNAPVAALLQYFHFDKAVSVCIGTLGLIYLLLLALLLPNGFSNPALFLSQMQLALQASIFIWLIFLVFLQRRSRNREA